MNVIPAKKWLARSTHSPASPCTAGSIPYRPAALFAHLAMTFGIMAIVGVALAAFEVTEAHPAYGPLYAVGLLSPCLGALVHARMAAGSLRPIRDLYWPVRLGRAAWMILALPASVAASYALAWAGGLPLDPTQLPSIGSLALGMLAWSSVMWAEETGWRGVLLPVLQERLGPLRATVLVAAAWILWHVPLLALLAMPATGYLWFAAQSLGLSLAMTWAFNRSGGVPVPVLIHGANNAVMVALEEAVPGRSAHDLMAVQALGPIVLGLAVALSTRGRLGLAAGDGRSPDGSEEEER